MEIDSIATLQSAFTSSGDFRLQAMAESMLFGRRNAMLNERAALEVVGAVVGVHATDATEARAYIRAIDREIAKIDRRIAEVKGWTFQSPV